MFVLIPIAFLLLSAYMGGALDQTAKGCLQLKSILVCVGQLPNRNELQNTDIQTLIMSQLPKRTRLSLNKTQLAASGIQKIEVQRSFIDAVENGYFASIGEKKNLKRLILRDVQGSAVVDKSMIQGLEQSLNYLTVTNGLTVNIADLAEIAHLTNLELINTTLRGSSADFSKLLPELRSLSVQKCNLSQLPWDALAKWIAKDNLRLLKLGDSKWTCDCSMMKLKDLQSGFVENGLQKLTCSGPPNVAGKQLSELTENDLCPLIEPNVKADYGKDLLKASGSTGGDVSNSRAGVIDGTNDIQVSGGLLEDEEQEEKNGPVRTEVIVAGAVVGVLVLIAVVFLIVYKCHLYPKNKNRDERTSRTHQNKRYANVIEEPSLQQYGNDNQAKENGKFIEGVPV